MNIVYPTSLLAASQFVNRYHRHLKAPIGHKFSLALIVNNKTEGVIIAGRPVSRVLAAKNYLEFYRVCSNGFPNACSMMMAAARKVGRTKGYSKFLTYTRVDELGTTMKADNWSIDGICKGRQWHGRKANEIIDKIRWIHS